MMSFNCLECDKQFDSERSLHAHIKKHGDGTEADKALCTRAEKDNTHRGAVMEAVSSKTKAGQPSGAALTYSISREEMCIGKMARW